MTCIRRNLDTQNCCNQWQKGIRTIDGQYPDDNREFEIRAGAGITITPITAGILITNSADVASSFTEGTNIEFTPSGDQIVIGVVDGPTFADDTTINADLIVNGDIIQSGASYETHAEHIYTADDYIIMRDGALAGLGSGDYSGFQVKLYDGVNDGRLVIDNSGTARVGDVGDEQPLLTRDESADLVDGNLIEWDGTNQKAIDAGIAVSGLEPKLEPTLVYNANNIKVYTYGKLAIVSNNGYQDVNAGYVTLPGFPLALAYSASLNTNGGMVVGDMWIEPNTTSLYIRVNSANQRTYGTLVYLTN
jgi:hypothetical protein